MDKEQLMRIQQMEQRLDTAQGQIQVMQNLLDELEDYLSEIKTLIAYYDSGLWRKDYLDDEAEKLPKDLKRGVLSEDGIFNLLTDYVCMKEQMQRICAEEL